VSGVARGQALALAAALEHGSEHPIASAVRAASAAEGGMAATAEAVRSIAGSGVEGCIDGVVHRIGKAQFVSALTGTPAPPGEIAAATPVWLGNEGGWLAALAFSDSLRSDAAQVIMALQAASKRIMILSGDDPAVVRAIAGRLGVADAQGGLSPEAKHAHVRALQERGAVVAMVGDGVNDAPVLAQAQLSIAMGSGAVLSQAQSDLVLQHAHHPAESGVGGGLQPRGAAVRHRWLRDALAGRDRDGGKLADRRAQCAETGNQGLGAQDSTLRDSGLSENSKPKGRRSDAGSGTRRSPESRVLSPASSWISFIC
jgi:soluble P-type ATPase